MAESHKRTSRFVCFRATLHSALGRTIHVPSSAPLLIAGPWLSLSIFSKQINDSQRVWRVWRCVDITPDLFCFCRAIFMSYLDLTQRAMLVCLLARPIAGEFRSACQYACQYPSGNLIQLLFLRHGVSITRQMDSEPLWSGRRITHHDKRIVQSRSETAGCVTCEQEQDLSLYSLLRGNGGTIPPACIGRITRDISGNAPDMTWAAQEVLVIYSMQYSDTKRFVFDCCSITFFAICGALSSLAECRVSLESEYSFRSMGRNQRLRGHIFPSHRGRIPPHRGTGPTSSSVAI